MNEDTAGDFAPYAWCAQCQRPARAHGSRRRHWRVCGPQTGTAIGPAWDVNLADYLDARDAEGRQG